MNKCGLISKNMKGKSYSKMIFNKINEELDYQIYNIENEEELSKLIDSKDFLFYNVTFPYKESVIKYLDHIDEFVKNTNACNLIVNKGGFLYGYNTDILGFEQTLNDKNVNFTDKNVLILGNGATSRTVVEVLKNKGTNQIVKGCRNIKDKNDVLLDIIDTNVNIIINTTPVGMNENDGMIIDPRKFKQCEVFIDLLYNPFKTKTALNFSKKTRVINGLDMLIHQAIYAYRLVFGECNVAFTTLKRYIISKTLNIVFIGLSTSGKSAIGKKLYDSLSFHKYIDTDKYIEQKTNMTVSQIFQTYEEPYFRKLETRTIKKLSNRIGFVISTGGGFVLDYKNYKYLRKNSLFIYLYKSNFDDYVNDKDRPLIKRKEDLEQMFVDRHNLYLKYSDIVVDSGLNNLEEVITDEIINY